MGRPHTPEIRARISRGVRRARERKRQRMEARPVLVDQWLDQGLVSAPVRSPLQARAAQAEAFIGDLGGPSEVTAMQRGIIDGWLMTAVAADLEFSRLVRGESDGERLATFVNSCRSNLLALGLERRAKEIALADYLDAKAREGSTPPEETDAGKQ